MNKQIIRHKLNRDSDHIAIKICGLTRAQDIEAVTASGIDYAGFVFAPSKRQLSILQAASLIRQLPASIAAVGIFVDAPPSLIVETVEKTGLNIVQLHGHETCGYMEILRGLLPDETEIWKSFSFPAGPKAKTATYDINSTEIGRKDYCSTLESNSPCSGRPDTWLLDSRNGKKCGGSGKPFDWEAALQLLPTGKIMLAGGLDRSNVSQAIRLIKPDGVDCSSGVELEGKKDKQKIFDFCLAVREAEQQLKEANHGSCANNY